MKFRSAITGRWVTRLFARRNPRTTVSEGSKAKAPAELVDCPYCGHRIATDATVCRWCGTDLLED